MLRCVRVFERAGAKAVQLEDQTLPKRCGHLDGKTLIPAAEMVGKIKAALDAETSAETLIITRTDAIAAEGLQAALDRAESYPEAGADVLFIKAPRDRAAMTKIDKRFAGRVPLLANMMEGGKTELLSANELESLGYSHHDFSRRTCAGIVEDCTGLFWQPVGARNDRTVPGPDGEFFGVKRNHRHAGHDRQGGQILRRRRS